MATTKRTLAAALATTTSVVVLIGATFGGSRSKPEESPFGSRDVLTAAVSTAVLSTYLAAEDARSHFQTQGTPVTLTAEGGVGVQVAMAYSPDREPADSASAASGVVLYRLDASADYGPLTRGANYLWMDAKGPSGQPWRGILISADGTRRNLMASFKYTPATEHNNFSPLDHARQYCNGLPGCIYSAAAEETVWVRCTQGCCEMQLATPAPKPRPRH